LRASARADAVVQGLTYTFATPVLGGQAAISLLGAPGHVDVGIDATLTGPRGNTISGHASDGRTTFADVFYQGSLKWNQGVHNTMVYLVNSPNPFPKRIRTLPAAWDNFRSNTDSTRRPVLAKLGHSLDQSKPLMQTAPPSGIMLGGAVLNPDSAIPRQLSVCGGAIRFNGQRRLRRPCSSGTQVTI
jgi:hypothetical protein